MKVILCAFIAFPILLFVYLGKKGVVAFWWLLLETLYGLLFIWLSDISKWAENQSDKFGKMADEVEPKAEYLDKFG